LNGKSGTFAKEIPFVCNHKQDSNTLGKAKVNRFLNKFLSTIPVLLALLITGTALAQAPAVVAIGITGTMHGVVSDPTGAVIPGTSLTLTTAQGKTVGATKSDGTGNYSFSGIVAGSYIISAQTTGFAAFSSQPIALAAGQSRRVNITLAIEESKQVMVVSDDSPQVSIASDQNASALIIKGNDLDALSDDPDELSSELQALAGPSAGPNGGQIYIDGFTGGQLPPKSSIREIRINQNPFSAEFDHLGYGRIEILTKPGTDKLHGQIQMMGNPKALNTGNPFTKQIPDYYSDQFNGNFSGPLSKKASFNLGVEYRNIQSANPYSVLTIGCEDPASPCNGAVFNPHSRWNVTPRFDVQLGAKNTLTTRFQWEHEDTRGNLSSNSLPSRATKTGNTELVLQITDAQVITDKIANETRFQWFRSNTESQATSTAPAINIPGYFYGGASSSQFSTDHNDWLELQNLTTIAAGAHTIKFGTRLRDNRDANRSNANTDGIFTFANLTAYANMLTDISNGLSFQQIQARGDGPSQLSYSAGKPGSLANVFDGALFVQDEWKVSPVLTLSPGFRFETQNHIPDHGNYAPRLSMAWALDGSAKKQAKTVLRAGFGYFYDRTGAGNFLNTERYTRAGTSGMQQYIINNPTCFSAVSVNFASCGTVSSSVPSYYRIAHDYRSQANQQIGISLERQLNKTSTIAITYSRTYGIHQDALLNANILPLPTTANPNPVRPDTTYNGNIYEYHTEGFYKMHQVIVNTRAQLGPNFSLFSFYQFAHADGDINGNPTNPNNLKADYGRSTFASTNLAVVVLNWNAPLGLRFSNFLFTHSGIPYNIALSSDLNNDSFYNDRPSYAPPGAAAGGSSGGINNSYIQTQFGLLDINPQAGEATIPVDLATGPAFVADNIRVARTFGFGPKLDNISSQQKGQAGPQMGAFGRPMGGGRGGGRDGGMGGAPSSGRKYSLNISAQALNAFNNINEGQPNGTLTAGASGTPGGLFGKSSALASGFGANNLAARRIMLQAVLSF
jgi:hypothetical protein